LANIPKTTHPSIPIIHPSIDHQSSELETMRQHYFSHNGKNMFVNPLSNVVATNKSDSLVSLRGTEAAASSSLAALLKGGYNAPRESMAPESLLQVLYQQQARQRQEAQAAQQAVLNPILLELVLNKATQSISSSTFPPAPTSRVRVPAQAAPEPVEVITVPCRARGMPQDHKFKASLSCSLLKSQKNYFRTTPGKSSSYPRFLPVLYSNFVGASHLFVNCRYATTICSSCITDCPLQNSKGRQARTRTFLLVPGLP
jgi:hypothetical protein